jgi:hypothetical protein
MNTSASPISITGVEIPFLEKRGRGNLGDLLKLLEDVWLID